MRSRMRRMREYSAAVAVTIRELLLSSATTEMPGPSPPGPEEPAEVGSLLAGPWLPTSPDCALPNGVAAVSGKGCAIEGGVAEEPLRGVKPSGMSPLDGAAGAGCRGAEDVTALPSCPE